MKKYNNKMFQIQIDAKEIEQALPDYKFIRRLGSGAFAAVHLVEHRKDLEQFALKKVNCFGMGQYEKAGAANQVRILSSLVHKNLIKIYSCLFDNSQDTLYIFMEYADSGDLSTLIEQAKEKKKRIPQSTVWKVINDVSDALKYLHHSQIIHRDLKPANVFRMGKSFKVGDMNISKVLKNGEAASTKTGSPFYTAPEVWDSEQYDNKCDIWSLGVMIYELCSLQVPYEIESVFQVSSRIKKQKQKNLPTIYSTSLNDLVKKMLEFNPANRLSADQIYKISRQKLNIQTQGLDQKATDSLMNTIVFPDTHQRWINLIPSLPPKTSRKDISSSQIQERDKSKSRQKSKKKNDNSSILQNHSGIFKTNERKPIQLPRNRSKSRLEKSCEKSQILPPISPSPNYKISSSKQKNSQKRIPSSENRARRKSITETISEVKSIINSQQLSSLKQ